MPATFPSTSASFSYATYRWLWGFCHVSADVLVVWRIVAVSRFSTTQLFDARAVRSHIGFDCSRFHIPCLERRTLPIFLVTEGGNQMSESGRMMGALRRLRLLSLACSLVLVPIMGLNAEPLHIAMYNPEMSLMPGCSKEYTVNQENIVVAVVNCGRGQTCPDGKICCRYGGSVECCDAKTEKCGDSVPCEPK